jgi:uncharacterized protein YjbI with pentapeptide repeats
MKMWLMKRCNRHIASAMLAVLLAACGGDGLPDFVPQFNVTEQDLYEPGRAEGGIVPQRGSGGVALQLEGSAVSEGLPLTGDTFVEQKGVDRFYFDLVRHGYLALSMSDAMLQGIEAIELYNASHQRLWRLDAQNRTLNPYWLYRNDYNQPAPRYEIRIVSARTVDAAQVLAWFGQALVPSLNRYDLGKISHGVVASCTDCNLSGAMLGGYKLEAAYLPRANLRNAWLVRLLDPAALDLGHDQVFKILWDSQQVGGARMSRAFLEGADFTGAIVTGLGQSPAEFEAAHLYGAIMNGLNLDGANMNAAFMSRTQVQGASMIAAQLDSAQLVNANLSGSNLRQATLTKAMLNGTNFSHANLEGANFKNAQILDVNFSNANLKGANFTLAGIQGADFTGADLSGATWTDGVKICATPSTGSCQ